MALEIVKTIVNEEMKKVTASTRITLRDVAEQRDRRWSLERDLQPAVNAAPVLYNLLVTAAESAEARERNVIKKPRLVSIALYTVFLRY